MSAAYTQCRYLKPHTGDQCTAEVVDADAEILLCVKHLARAVRLVKDKQAAAKKTGVKS